MRWLTLYARSRQVPAALAAVPAGAVAVSVFGRAVGAADDPRLSVLVLAAAATALAVGLAGPDLALDRTAAVRWPPRRAAHLLGGAVLAAAVLLTARAGLGLSTDLALVVRDSAGLTGLAALGAAWCGRSCAWLPPFAALALAFVLPTGPGTLAQVLTWPMLPPGTPAATWAALVAAAVGTAVYALGGPRR
ncbi:hypothetical protein ACFVGM_05890 [Kitasatospora purpeofusca]|uniref:hypothetical protein n=1 Tax=Kitasatospora purpeofusca TaxID=67352 RepID=UPI00367C913A